MEDTISTGLGMFAAVHKGDAAPGHTRPHIPHGPVCEGQLKSFARHSSAAECFLMALRSQNNTSARRVKGGRRSTNGGIIRENSPVASCLGEKFAT